jgi:hypothetical protein
VAQGGDSGGHAVAGISGGERRRLAIGAPNRRCHVMRMLAHSHCARLRDHRRQRAARPPALHRRRRAHQRCVSQAQTMAWVRVVLNTTSIPVSGLDSFQADKVVDKLAELAHADGAVVLASLHAPRSASFARCDDLLLMAPHGRVAYCGPAAQALAWFAGAAGGGHACPAHTNPAEFLIDLVSIGEHKKAVLGSFLPVLTQNACRFELEGG